MTKGTAANFKANQKKRHLPATFTKAAGGYALEVASKKAKDYGFGLAVTGNSLSALASAKGADKRGASRETSTVNAKTTIELGGNILTGTLLEDTMELNTIQRPEQALLPQILVALLDKAICQTNNAKVDAQAQVAKLM